MAIRTSCDSAHLSESRKKNSRRLTAPATLFAILATFAVSATQAQILDEQFIDDLQKDPSTTADWDCNDTVNGILCSVTGATELKLPITTSLAPVQSLTGALLPAAPSSAIDVTDSSAARGVAAGDLNGDGLDDLVFANSTANRIYFNDGVGVLTFTRGANITGGGNSRSVAIADFNGDGHLDVVFAEFGGGQASRVHFNNGGGVNPVFDTNGADLGDPALAGDSVAVGDIDNDGDIDVVLGFDQSYVQVFRNDGFGNFSDGEKITDTTPEFGYHARTVLLADLDADGDLDVVAARELDPSRVYLNDGNGNFGTQQSVGGVNVDNALPAPDTATIGDVNGDGLPDLIIGNDGSGTVLGPAEANYLFINSGNPADVFPTLTFSFADFANTNAMKLLDFDKDGDLDLVTADYVSGNGNAQPGPNRVYINDPVANAPNIFPANGVEFTVDSNVTKSMDFGDFDGDNDLDLVFGNEDANLSTAINRIVENVGVASGVNADQLYAFGESIDVSSALSGGVFLDPSTSAANSDVASERVFKYWLSDDGGVTWVRAHRNRSVAFPAPAGNTIRWRVDFDSPSPMLRPTIGRMLLRVNSTPSFTSTAVTTATQDVAYQYDITATDSQNDILDIRETATLPAWLTLTDNGDGTATLAGTPTSGDVAGPNDVDIEVVDGAGQGDTQSFTIVVTDVNDPPVVIAPTGDQTYDQGDTVNLDASLAFNDPDGDTLAYSDGGTLPDGLTLDTMTGIISGTLTNDDAINGPDYAVVITATEVGTPDLFSVDDTFTITVNNVNDAPTVVTPPVDQTILQGTDVNLDISTAFEDIDGDTLTYSATGLPASLSLDMNLGIVTGTLTNDDVVNGPDYAITVTADDGNGGTVDASFTLTVTDVNDDPEVIAPTGNQTFAQGDTVNLDAAAAFSDPDGNVLTYSAAGLPGSLGIDGMTGVISGTLTNDDAVAAPGGVYSVTVTADDGNGGTADDSFTITVNNVNDAPMFTSTPLTAATEGSLYSYTAVATDIDGDDLSFSAPVLPVWLSFDAATGVVSGVPTSAQLGIPQNVSLTVNDGNGGGDVQTFEINVVAAADAPVILINGNDPETVEQGDTYTDAGASATDAQDGGVPVVVVSNNVDTDTVGQYAVVYEATDSAGNTAQASREVNVVDTVAPVITLVGSDTVTLTVGATYTDAGATADDGLNGDITADIVTDNPVDTSTAGTYTVTYNVTDASGNAAAEVTRTVTVNAATPPPPPPSGGGGGGGGAASLPLLILLAGTACGLRRRRRLDG